MIANTPQFTVNNYPIAPPRGRILTAEYTVTNDDHSRVLIASTGCDGVTFPEVDLWVRVVLFNATGEQLVVGGNFNEDVADLPNFTNFEAIHIGEGNWIVL
jgi:hypothetical protein